MWLTLREMAARVKKITFAFNILQIRVTPWLHTPRALRDCRTAHEVRYIPGIGRRTRHDANAVGGIQLSARPRRIERDADQTVVRAAQTGPVDVGNVE